MKARLSIRNEHRRVRFALLQRLRSPEAAAARAEALPETLVDKTDIQFSESFEVGGREMFKHACRRGSRVSFRPFFKGLREDL